MTPLPWTTGTAPASTTEVVVMASRLELSHWRHVPSFLLAALRLRRRFRKVPGGIGLALHAEPSRRTFWTLSAWADEAALAEFTDDPVHRGVMQRFRPVMADSTFTTWLADGESVPEWAEARQRIQEAQR